MSIVTINFPGTNRESDLIKALKNFTTAPIHSLHHTATGLPQDCRLVCIPGGFSYGDYLRSGAIAARDPITEAIKKYAQDGGKILGICNGFQILTEMNLLPGMLVRNRKMKFICANVELTLSTNRTIFTDRYPTFCTLRMPVAHGYGAYTAPDDVIHQLHQEDRILFRYATDINGSKNQIAGIINQDRTIVGLMPHPENAVFSDRGTTDGSGFFLSILQNIFHDLPQLLKTGVAR